MTRSLLRTCLDCKQAVRGLPPLLGAGQPRPGGLPRPRWAGRLPPPKMREASFRRARLCQLTDQLEEAWLPPSAWAAVADATRSIPDGADVVLAFDGSFNGDTTVLVVASVAERPHVDLVELWEAGGRQVPVVDVEQAIRQACRRWRVLEIAADPFRWARSLQLLDQEGLPILEYPQSPGRMTPATARFYEAVVNGQLTHSGDHRLARPRRERGTAGGCSRCPAGQGAEGLAPADRRRRGRRHGP